jgi:hypothetical protein
LLGLEGAGGRRRVGGSSFENVSRGFNKDIKGTQFIISSTSAQRENI